MESFLSLLAQIHRLTVGQLIVINILLGGNAATALAKERPYLRRTLMA
jgi:hypothetical protein